MHPPALPAPRDTLSATRPSLPCDLLVLLVEARLAADCHVATADFGRCALVSREWRDAVGEVAARRRLLCLERLVGPAPTAAPHGGPFDGPLAVAPSPEGGAVIADTRNGRLRCVDGEGRVLDDGSEMEVSLPDSVAVQRDGLDGDPVVWATNRGAGPIALTWGRLRQRGRLRQGVSLPRADGARQRVLGIALSCRGASREHNGRPDSTALLLLFSDRFEAYSACASRRAPARPRPPRASAGASGPLGGASSRVVQRCASPRARPSSTSATAGGTRSWCTSALRPAAARGTCGRLGATAATAVWRSASRSASPSGVLARASVLRSLCSAWPIGTGSTC